MPSIAAPSADLIVPRTTAGPPPDCAAGALHCPVAIRAAARTSHTGFDLDMGPPR
jgi:hypothetical protein